MFVRDGPRSSELDVNVGHRSLPAREQTADVQAELVVVGGVNDRRGEWTAERKLVVDEEAPPRCQDQADRFGKVSAAASVRSSSS